ncbi:MAG: DNA polymerase IV [Clostridia bacterium]|nr:DNA polymerase IV [Clostridia bacterium]
MARLIFHVDVNSAYLSWESARRVRNGEPDLRLIPAVIGGDREKRTGVVLAKSIPAKKCGVITGEPIAFALRKCPDLVLAKPDFRLYEQNSRAFMAVCRQYAPVAEQVSIDECFLDMSGTERIYPDPLQVAAAIKNTVRDTLGFTVNVGISTNKLLAKMASDFEKPDRIHTLFPDEIAAKLWPLPVGELFTVGKATAAKLEAHGITTVGALAKAELPLVQAIVGRKWGQQLHDYANGIDDSPVLAEGEDAKGYSNSTTLEKDVTTAEEGHRVLLALADSVSSRLRADGVKARCVAVTIRSNDFKNHSHQKKLKEATDVTKEVFEVSKALFDELWDHRTPLRLLGVALTDIDRFGMSQMTFFPDAEKEKQRKIDRAADDIRSRFGTGAILRGGIYGTNVGKKHKAQFELASEKDKRK